MADTATDAAASYGVGDEIWQMALNDAIQAEAELIAKPFSYRELRARNAGVLRRSPAAPAPAGAERQAGADQSAGPPRGRR